MSTPAETLDTGIVPDVGEGQRSPRSGRERRRFEGLDRTGLVIVDAAALIDSLNDTAQSLAAKPFTEWRRARSASRRGLWSGGWC